MNTAKKVPITTRRQRRKPRIGRPFKHGATRLVSDPVTTKLKAEINEEVIALDTTSGGYLARVIEGLTRSQRIEAFQRSQTKAADTMAAAARAEEEAVAPGEPDADHP